MQQMKVLREGRAWSQAELARQAGMHPSTISLIEADRFVPGSSQLQKIADALGVDVQQLEDVADDARD